MGRSIHGENDGRENAVRRGRHGCAPCLRAQAVRGFKTWVSGLSDVAGLEPERGFRAVLGVPGRSRTAHVMQFRAVGVEGPGEELAPEALEAGGCSLSV